MSSIFVSIVSYRDAECYWTIQDLFKKAKNPELISVGLCLQTDKNDHYLVQNPIDSYYGQIRVLRYQVSESKGVCWARNKVQTLLLKDEEYYLQIDAHMRFVQDWDEKLQLQLRACPAKKPILSTMPPGYWPPDNYQHGIFTLMVPTRFDDDGMVISEARSWSLDHLPSKPVRQYTLAAGFIFSKSDLMKTIIYDPYIYWLGEEFDFMIRSWSHGWDIFAPNDVIIFHYYADRKRHWGDHQDWWPYWSLSCARVRHILGMEISTDPKILENKDKYWLGNVRTIQEYERKSGINFHTRTIKQLTPEEILQE